MGSRHVAMTRMFLLLEASYCHVKFLAAKLVDLTRQKGPRLRSVTTKWKDEAGAPHQRGKKSDPGSHLSVILFTTLLTPKVLNQQPVLQISGHQQGVL